MGETLPLETGLDPGLLPQPATLRMCIVMVMFPTLFTLSTKA